MGPKQAKTQQGKINSFSRPENNLPGPDASLSGPAVVPLTPTSGLTEADALSASLRSEPPLDLFFPFLER